MNNKIQRVELNTHYDISIHCPFCGTKVLDMEASQSGSDPVKPCPHTLFVAHDEGFEFRSERFDADLGITGVADDDVDIPENGKDGLTDQVTITDAIKFASFVPAPSFFGSYVGFAPLDK